MLSFCLNQFIVPYCLTYLLNEAMCSLIFRYRRRFLSIIIFYLDIYRVCSWKEG